MRRTSPLSKKSPSTFESTMASMTGSPRRLHVSRIRCTFESKNLVLRAESLGTPWRWREEVLGERKHRLEYVLEFS